MDFGLDVRDFEFLGGVGVVADCGGLNVGLVVC